MSRTFKDRPNKIRFPEEYKYDTDRTYIPGTHYWIYLPTTKTKKKRSVDTEWHLYRASPSWWTHDFMNVPMRARGRLWERKVLLEDLEETDPPGVSHKPHLYYW